MRIVTGIDVVYLPRFKKTLQGSGSHFLQRVFLSSELDDQNIKRLASVFAAKEAVIKAFGLPTDSWHQIKISTKKDGAPLVEVANHKETIESLSLSISHDGKYVVAQFVALLRE